MREQMSYAEVENNLDNTLDQVCLSCKPLLVTRKDGGNVVIMSENCWNSIQETLYLASSEKDWHDICKNADIKECSETLPR